MPLNARLSAFLADSFKDSDAIVGDFFARVYALIDQAVLKERKDSHVTVADGLSPCL